MLAYLADIPVKSGVTGVVQLVSIPIAEEQSKNLLYLQVKFFSILRLIDGLVTYYITSADMIDKFGRAAD